MELMNRVLTNMFNPDLFHQLIKFNELTVRVLTDMFDPTFFTPVIVLRKELTD